MTISAVSGATTAAPQSTSTTGQTITDYNSFLQIFIAQLKNQDPTSPTDPSQFVSELASFSSVEQQVQTNTTLTQMLSNSSLSQAEGMIGHTVTSSDGKTTGNVVSITLSSSGTTANLDNGSTLAITPDVTIS